MQKVYLLLRSNKQTGPYSLEELLKLNLKPFDLVWVDGRSAAWQYPSEIPALKPYVPETPHADLPYQPVPTAAMDEQPATAAAAPSYTPAAQPAQPKRIFVSVPKKDQAPLIQANASALKEEARPAASPYAPSAAAPLPRIQPVKEEAAQTHYTRSLQDVEEDYTSWVYRQKTRKKASVSPKDMVLAVLILAVIGGGYYLMSRPSVTSSIVPAEKAAVAALPPVTAAPASGSPEQITAKERVEPRVREKEQSLLPNGLPARPVKKLTRKNPVVMARSQTVSSVPSSQNPMPAGRTNSNIPDDQATAGSQEPVVKAPARPAQEKKKKLGEVLKGIFSKKENREEPKEEPVVTETPKPANNRQAARRDDNQSVPDHASSGDISLEAIKDQVDLSSNAPDNWMMGVRNLKITMRNRSSLTIQSATVTVNYYDQNNQLLEKKLIYFSNLGPKAKATQAAPDQKWADHVDFKLSEARARDDRYAQY